MNKSAFQIEERFDVLRVDNLCIDLAARIRTNFVKCTFTISCCMIQFVLEEVIRPL